MIKNDRMREYADLLEANGFTIYEANSGEWFMYSQMVDDKECFGLFQVDVFGRVGVDGYRTEMFRTYSHTMPIVPSRQDGSAMYVHGVEDNDFTVEAARKVAQPSNTSPNVTGVKRNYRSKRDMVLCTKRTKQCPHSWIKFIDGQWVCCICGDHADSYQDLMNSVVTEVTPRPDGVS